MRTKPFSGRRMCDRVTYKSAFLALYRLQWHIRLIATGRLELLRLVNHATNAEAESSTLRTTMLQAPCPRPRQFPDRDCGNQCPGSGIYNVIR